MSYNFADHLTCDHHKSCPVCPTPNHMRTLEATIKNMANDLATATEWNLATLEELSLLKSTSTSRKERQLSICTKMLNMCQAVFDKIDWGVGPQRHYYRLQQLRDDWQKGGFDSLDAAARMWAESLRP